MSAIENSNFDFSPAEYPSAPQAHIHYRINAGKTDYSSPSREEKGLYKEAPTTGETEGSEVSPYKPSFTVLKNQHFETKSISSPALKEEVEIAILNWNKTTVNANVLLDEPFEISLPISLFPCPEKIKAGAPYLFSYKVDSNGLKKPFVTEHFVYATPKKDALLSELDRLIEGLN